MPTLVTRQGQCRVAPSTSSCVTPACQPDPGDRPWGCLVLAGLGRPSVLGCCSGAGLHVTPVWEPAATFLSHTRGTNSSVFPLCFSPACLQLPLACFLLPTVRLCAGGWKPLSPLNGVPQMLGGGVNRRSPRAPV